MERMSLGHHQHHGYDPSNGASCNPPHSPVFLSTQLCPIIRLQSLSDHTTLLSPSRQAGVEGYAYIEAADLEVGDRLDGGSFGSLRAPLFDCRNLALSSVS
jgi:hypothetical protein